jgi:L-gulonate 5-dehydrogenase
MHAAVAYAPYDIRYQQRPKPEAGPGEVLIDVSAVGICGSDVHLFRGEHPYRVFPMVYGHEISGRVAAVGEGVTGVAPGLNVVVEPLIACGHCYPCRHGRPNCCVELQVIGVHRDGGLQESVAVPAERVFAVPSDLDARVAALCEPFSIGMQAAARGEIAAGDRVVILGAGPIGLTVLAIARSRGAAVATVDLLPGRLEHADQLGAELLVDASREDVKAAVLGFTDAEGASVVVEATGNQRVMESTVDLVAAGGRIVLVGLTTKPVTFPGLEFTRKELTIAGSRNNAGRFGDAVRFVSEHRDEVAGMITQHFPLREVDAAFRLAESNPAGVCKVVVEVQG